MPRATQANCVSPVSILTAKLDDDFIFFSFPEVQPDFELSFENSPSTETLDYVLLDGFTEDLKEVIQRKKYGFLLHSLYSSLFVSGCTLRIRITMGRPFLMQLNQKTMR